LIGIILVTGAKSLLSCLFNGSPRAFKQNPIQQSLLYLLLIKKIKGVKYSKTNTLLRITRLAMRKVPVNKQIQELLRIKERARNI